MKKRFKTAKTSIVIGILLVNVIFVVLPTTSAGPLFKSVSPCIRGDIERTKQTEIISKLTDENDVLIFKLRENGAIKKVREKISLFKYEEYCEKMMSSETMDDSFAILKEFNIVPKNMNLQHFSEIMNVKTAKLQILKKLFLNNKYFDGYIVNRFCFVKFEINPPVANDCDLFTLYAESKNGGQGWIGFKHFSTESFISFSMWFYIGILYITPYLHLNNTARFTGFAVIARTFI